MIVDRRMGLSAVVISFDFLRSYNCNMMRIAFLFASLSDMNYAPFCTYGRVSIIRDREQKNFSN